METIVQQQNKTMMAAFAKQDVETIGRLYTSDAQFMPPNKPRVEGIDQIKTAFANMIGSGVCELKLKSSDLISSPNTATEIGEFSLHVADGMLVDQGNYVVVWKHVGEQWLIYRDLVTSILPST